MKIELAKTEIIHFIGIGGIGMSGIAELLSNKNFIVTGSDLSSSPNVDRLRNLGIEISIGCLLYTSPSPRDATLSRMPSSA